MVSLEELSRLLTRFTELADKRQARCWAPTRYAEGAASRSNAGVKVVSCLVFDCDRVEPDWARLEGHWYLAHTTYQHTPEHPRWRLVLPLAVSVPAEAWRDIWLRARAALCPETDPSCKDPSRQYYLPSHPRDAASESTVHAGPLLDPATLPELPPAPRPSKGRRVRVSSNPRRGQAYMDGVIRNLETATRPGRNNALNGAAWTLGRWIAAGALEQAEVEDALYTAAVANGLVADDGERQCWATIRSGLGAGLREPVDLEAKRG
jgi:putative DNA primase/helicase